MSINWNNHIDRLRSQIADLRSTLRVIKTKAHDERPGLEQTTAQLRELVDKNESQKALYQFPKILHKILHNPAVGAIILGPNGEHLLFNTAAERLLGSDLMADALAEKSGNFGFYQTDKVTKYTNEQLPWQRAVFGEQVPEVDLFVRRQGYIDGLWIKATSTALKSETNDIGGAVVFLVDITEQVQVENQIQSTCEALEQQISQIGSAQLELQLLTEKLGKLDYLPEATPDLVPSENETLAKSERSKTERAKTADGTSQEDPAETEKRKQQPYSEIPQTETAEGQPSENQKTEKPKPENAESESDNSEKESSERVGSETAASDKQIIATSSHAAESSNQLQSQVSAASAATSQDSASVIDYASDELAKWTDVDSTENPSDVTPKSAENSSTEVVSNTSMAPNTVRESTAADPSHATSTDETSLPQIPIAEEIQNFAAYEAQIEADLASAAETAETLEEKAKKVNESIVQQLTSEIFAIANQVSLEPESSAKPGEQEFFAPDSSEKQMASLSPTTSGPAGPTIAPGQSASDAGSTADSALSQETEKHSKSSKKSAQKQAESEPAGAKRRRILIVDDIPVNQKLLRLQLKRLGFECEAANNGDAAQKAIVNGDFALVLMDLDMPIMDGFESTAAIRKNEQGTGKRIPIVAMTSYDRQEDRERCLAAGMDDFLSKGATQKQLHEVVERCMRAVSTEPPKPPTVPPEQLKETGLDIESLQKQFDKEEVQDVSRLFLSAVNTFIDCIQLGIEEKDAGAVTHFAHSVKGPCAALGIDEMTRLTSEIMSDAEAGNWTQVRVKYMKLKSSFGEVRDQLRELCTPGYV